MYKTAANFLSLSVLNLKIFRVLPGCTVLELGLIFEFSVKTGFQLDFDILMDQK